VLTSSSRRNDILLAVLLRLGSAWAREERLTDLKNIPPDQQVEAVQVCQGQYRVKLRDGTTERFTEFDLRFKTDSGPSGPRLGVPALVPAGVRGERAWLIFSRPEEMAVFIKEKC